MLTALQRFVAAHGYMPSVRELGRELGGLAPATVQHHLVALRRAGLVEHQGGAHGLRFTPRVDAVARPEPATSPEPAGMTSPHLPPAGGVQAGGGGGGGAAGGGRAPSWATSVPGLQVLAPLLGTLAAGRPFQPSEEPEEFIPIPASLARGSCHVLRVDGSALLEEGILDGDLIVVESGSRVASGEVALLCLPDGTATLKRVHVEPRRIRLLPVNGSQNVRGLHVDEVGVRGRVVGLIRRYA